MPIKFTDNHICEKCKKSFEWNYFQLIRQNVGSTTFKVEAMPQGKTLVHNFQQRDIGIYEVEVNCPHCDFDNHFSFTAK